MNTAGSGSGGIRIAYPAEHLRHSCRRKVFIDIVFGHVLMVPLRKTGHSIRFRSKTSVTGFFDALRLNWPQDVHKCRFSEARGILLPERNW